ncbi:hypothetical protein DOTSEDRAFT_136631 [Dothistroma septosporum NZE10]|uniref:Protein BCP1 n=1 Tax=Dothistroma septosporum (strain NZE10 / CBS 128990) TaxID=675120 RepID=N1PID2_DOTSN|nr:hypothetical protein DOTSEDRAFT_136631 [Dothistroma septosporum NZE10]
MDVDGEDSGSDEDLDILNIDFEWFDVNPKVDFHGLKTLLRQLLDIDNQLFDLSELADLILSQPLLGNTVKCDGEESDPYAFLTVLNLHQYKDKAVIKQLTEYIVRKSTGLPLERSLKDLLNPEDSSSQVGLILSERFINMPYQIMPPLYTFLTSEFRGAIENNNTYPFTHFLVLSKTYLEVAAFEADPSQPAKKKSKSSSNGDSEVFYFHDEDEILQKYAQGTATYGYEKADAEPEASDAKRTFSEWGMKPQGHLILIEAGKFEGAVKGVEKALSA